VTQTPTLRRLSVIRQRKQDRLREEAARLQGRVLRLEEQVDGAAVDLTEGRQQAAVNTAGRHAAMSAEAGTLRDFGALVSAIEADRQRLLRLRQTLEELRGAHAEAVEERTIHNRRLTRVRRQCENLATMISEAELRAENMAEFHQD